MNQQLIQTINQLKSIRNPQQMAMNCLQQSAQRGNPMAKNLLNQINSGNTQGAEQILSNFMNTQVFTKNGVIMTRPQIDRYAICGSSWDYDGWIKELQSEAE